MHFLECSEHLVEGDAEVEEQEKKGRKRKKTPEDRTTRKAKLMRNSGNAYVSTSESKKQIFARKIKPPCREKCRLHCKRTDFFKLLETC